MDIAPGWIATLDSMPETDCGHDRPSKPPSSPQVSEAMQVVWEFINPHFHRAPDGSETNAMFRTLHYLPEGIPWMVKSSGGWTGK